MWFIAMSTWHCLCYLRHQLWRNLSATFSRRSDLEDTSQLPGIRRQVVALIEPFGLSINNRNADVFMPTELRGGKQDSIETVAGSRLVFGNTRLKIFSVSLRTEHSIPLQNSGPVAPVSANTSAGHPLRQLRQYLQPLHPPSFWSMLGSSIHNGSWQNPACRHS